MFSYIVLYRPKDSKPIDEPLGFKCSADDTEHAEEQCRNAYPDADIVWVWGGDSLDAALTDYYG